MEITETKLRDIESKIRPILFYMCSFIFLYAALKNYFPDILMIKIIHIPVFIPLLVLPSIIFTKTIIKMFTALAKEKEWERKKQLDEYKFLINFIRVFAVSIFYFYLQTGLVLTLIPSFEKVLILGVPLFLPLFISNCFLIVLFYQKNCFSH